MQHEETFLLSPRVCTHIKSGRIITYKVQSNSIRRLLKAQNYTIAKIVLVEDLFSTKIAIMTFGFSKSPFLVHFQDILLLISSVS